MKKIKKSIFLIITVLLINAVAFAQIDIDPADLGGVGTVNPLDETAVPIDQNLLIIVGVVLVYMFNILKMRKKNS